MAAKFYSMPKWRRTLSHRKKLYNKVLKDLDALEALPRENIRQRSQLLKLVLVQMALVDKLSGEAELLKADADAAQYKRDVFNGKVVKEQTNIIDLAEAERRLAAAREKRKSNGS